MSQQLPTLKQLMANLPQRGRVEWIAVRTGKKKPLTITDSIEVLENGLKDDHYSGRSGKRSVTLIQKEHLDVIASMLHRDSVKPEELRRNIVVSGINLLALKGYEFSIGTAVLKMTGLCHPCSRMEQTLGAGGYNAVRGHGGITASVVKGGIIKLHDTVALL